MNRPLESIGDAITIDGVEWYEAATTDGTSARIRQTGESATVERDPDGRLMKCVPIFASYKEGDAWSEPVPCVMRIEMQQN